jgi:hypothetical protein
VVINDAAEQAYAASFATPAGFWIGLTDCLVVLSFRWATGPAPTYTNWGAGQPDDAGGWERGVQIRGDGTWNDMDLTDPPGMPYLCEFDGVPSLGPYPAGTYCDTTQNTNCGTCGHVCASGTACDARYLVCK